LSLSQKFRDLTLQAYFFRLFAEGLVYPNPFASPIYMRFYSRFYFSLHIHSRPAF